jgi:phosphatidylglycerophosphate synthase
MLDARIRHLIDPPLTRLGQGLAQRGWTADQITLLGLAFGLTAAIVLAVGLPGWLALIPLLAGRLADGLDGAVARANQGMAGQKSDFGGYLDILCDMAFYAAIPLAFALRDPANAPVVAFLLATFYVNAASFLGFAILAAKRGMETKAQGEKSLYYSAGLLEGTETIFFFVLICLWPGAFIGLALIFAALCLFTAIARSLLARKVFG